MIWNFFTSIIKLHWYFSETVHRLDWVVLVIVVPEQLLQFTTQLQCTWPFIVIWDNALRWRTSRVFRPGRLMKNRFPGFNRPCCFPAFPGELDDHDPQPYTIPRQTMWNQPLADIITRCYSIHLRKKKSNIILEDLIVLLSSITMTLKCIVIWRNVSICKILQIWNRLRHN